jgi:hypothetical protein
MSVPERHDPFTHEHYEYLLSCALQSGYEFVGFSAMKDMNRDDQLACWLRHDCDNDLTAALAMALVEQRFGVRSTYFVMLRSAMYNIMSIPNSELVRDIIRSGHAIGLHFDEHRYPDATAEQLADQVDWERTTLSHEFGVPIEVVSFHQPSQRVLAGQFRIRCVNTYDRRDMKGVYYLSDSNTVWREGDPSRFFQERRQRKLQLLIHPEWWTGKPMTVREKWNQMLTNNFNIAQESLLRREKTYTQRQGIFIRLA